MRVCMRVLACLLLLAAVSAAADDDGLAAPPSRWTHPRGPASGSGVSRAEAPETYGGVAWKLSVPGTVLAPPVTWDGVAFVVAGSASKATLLAVDVEDGAVLARTSVKKPGTPRPAAWDGAVFLLEDARRLVQFDLAGNRFVRRWTFDGGADPGPARVYEGEIYLPTAAGLQRLRAGSKTPVWTAKGDYCGEPAVLGAHVYALRRAADGAVTLVAHDRKDGAVAAECALGAATKRGGRVVVGSQAAAVLLPPDADGLWVLLSRKLERETPQLAVDRREKLLTQPVALDGAFLAMTEQGAWALLLVGKKRGALVLATKAKRPDLVTGSASATNLGGTSLFGSWAARVRSNRIVWHLDERKDERAFAKGVRWGAVPAGHRRLLVVPRDGKSVLAVVPEEMGS